MSIRWKLLLTISLALAINLIVGYYAAVTYKQATQEAALIRDHSSRVVATALTAQVHFKKQVQEWKNILLRGHEKPLYGKYLQQFFDEEEHTRRRTQELISYLEKDNQAFQIANTFLNAHNTLGHQYREALLLYDRSEQLSHITVDKQVRGIDRRPTDLIDEVVSATLAFRDLRLEKSADQLKSIELKLFLVVIGLLSLTVFILLSMADRLIAIPITRATSVAMRISRGDLAGEVPLGGNDEVGQLLLALQTMQSNLRASQEELHQEKALLAQRVRARTKELNFANEELAKAAKAKDLFLATMSHELRTPLTTILGLTEMLKDQLYGPINENQDKTLQTIDESSRHLLTLINDILDVAKIESGKMELKLDYIPIEQLVEASIRLVKASAKRKHQDLAYEIDPAVKLVYGDSRRLKQLLVNLLGNAVKFTPDDGQIGLEVTAAPDNNRVHLTVWDTGIGIDQEKIEQLFQPFVQLDNEATRRYSGTGLGLTLVNRMALLHKGAVSVESEPNKGSRFTVSLPWDINQNEPTDLGIHTQDQDSAYLPPEQLKEITILLAEDNHANRIMTEEFLTHQGFQVITAITGLEALTLARDCRPDIILMDVQLEEMTGLEVTERLRTMPGFARLPIIALTALAMPGDRERCLEAGMDDYISKPVGLKELQKRVVNHLSHVGATSVQAGQ
ncbi:MAG: ATP-binding protein [Chromatiales bacterium]|nr:ATP-binding protein [Chromatiales bacterium]